jgi:hypothetical protein
MPEDTPRLARRASAAPGGGSSSTTFTPLQDPVTHADIVAPNPAPNASVPAVPTCRVIVDP